MLRTLAKKRGILSKVLVIIPPFSFFHAFGDFIFLRAQKNEASGVQLAVSQASSKKGAPAGGLHSAKCLEAVLKLIPDVTHVRRFVMLSVAEASFPPASVADSSTPLRSAQNDRAIAHRREGAK